MATWGTLWGLKNPWGNAGPEFSTICDLADERILVQMDDTTGNRDFRELMCVFAEPFGRFLDVANDVGAGFNLQTAVGEQLDFIGSVIDLQRSGLDDTQYRVALQVQATILQGQTDGDWTGSVNDILTMVRLFIGTAVVTPVVYALVTPYSFTLDIPGTLTSAQTKVLFRLLCRAVYAGVLGFINVDVPGDNLWGSVHGASTNEGVWCSVHGNNTGVTCAVWSYVLTTDVCF